MDLTFIFMYFMFIYVTKTLKEEEAMNLRKDEMHGRS